MLSYLYGQPFWCSLDSWWNRLRMTGVIFLMVFFWNFALFSDILYLNNVINKIVFNSIKGTESIHRPYDQFHSPRKTGIITPQTSRFKVWISVLKFNLFPKFSSLNEFNESENVVSVTNNIFLGDAASSSEPNVKGGGAGYPTEECSGMLRIWDGPLREVPICNDLNWWVK